VLVHNLRPESIQNFLKIKNNRKGKNMNEQSKGEGAFSPENQGKIEEEIKLHKELQEAMDREEEIMKEIDKVFESTPDRSEAEKIILEKWAPLMDEAAQKSKELTTRWLEVMKKSMPEFETEPEK
jgi:hypothetical protein